MCNAYNHSPDCNCGWGGDGNGGSSWEWRKSTTGSGDPSNKIIDLARECGHSIIIPVRCWYCNEIIYLYANEYGSFCVFEEIGIPWKKHDCSGKNLNIHVAWKKDFSELALESNKSLLKILENDWYYAEFLEFNSNPIEKWGYTLTDKYNNRRQFYSLIELPFYTVFKITLKEGGFIKEIKVFCIPNEGESD
jgi:hypothetical protein